MSEVKEKVVNIDSVEEKKVEQEVINIASKTDKKETDEESNIVKFTRTYNFEGENISEIDLSGMENITADDMIKANKVLSASGNIAILPETNLEYALVIAASATDKPIEFYKALRPNDAMKVKNKVTSFFFGEE